MNTSTFEGVRVNPPMGSDRRVKGSPEVLAAGQGDAFIRSLILAQVVAAQRGGGSYIAQ